LTHTPLYVSDKAAEEGSSSFGDRENYSHSSFSENQRILSQMDTAVALHLTPKDIRKQVNPSPSLPSAPPSPSFLLSLCSALLLTSSLSLSLVCPSAAVEGLRC
jgi:hypothetical protein